MTTVSNDASSNGSALRVADDEFDLAARVPPPGSSRCASIAGLRSTPVTRHVRRVVRKVEPGADGDLEHATARA